VDLTALRDGLNAAVPFNRYLGIELTALAPGRCEARLPDRGELHNHIASQHAGALFTLADAASGGAFTAGMGERIAEVRPLVRSATIDYTKIARGAITARAVADGLDDALAALDRDGRVDIPVRVSMFDAEENEVARVQIEWSVKQQHAPAGA
jgi:acyl-coenzyme A thioesterase PaaI-like protein